MEAITAPATLVINLQQTKGVVQVNIANMMHYVLTLSLVVCCCFDNIILFCN